MDRKQKGTSNKIDFSKVVIENLDDYIQLFYEEESEKKAKGA